MAVSRATALRRPDSELSLTQCSDALLATSPNAAHDPAAASSAGDSSGDSKINGNQNANELTPFLATRTTDTTSPEPTSSGGLTSPSPHPHFPPPPSSSGDYSQSQSQSQSQTIPPSSPPATSRSPAFGSSTSTAAQPPNTASSQSIKAGILSSELAAPVSGNTGETPAECMRWQERDAEDDRGAVPPEYDPNWAERQQ